MVCVCNIHTMPKFEDIARLPIIDSKWYFDKDYQVLKWGLFQRFCYITFLKFLSWYILLQKAKFFLKPATSKAQRCSSLGYFFLLMGIHLLKIHLRPEKLDFEYFFVVQALNFKTATYFSFCDERTKNLSFLEILRVDYE